MDVKTLKKLMIICIIAMAVTVYYNPSLMKLQKETAINNILNTNTATWYSDNIQPIIEIEKPKILGAIEVQVKSSISNLINNLNLYILKKNGIQETPLKIKEDITLLDLMIGDSSEKVIELLGEPARKDASSYGFKWYIYNQDYNKYLQVGVQEGKVVGLYTNSMHWQSNSGVQVGTSKEIVEDLYGTPIEYYKKGNTLYHLNNLDESNTYLVNNYYVTFFFDLHNNSNVTAIQIIDQRVEEALAGFYGPASEELRISFERQIFDLANAVRARSGLPTFQWNDQAAVAARKQSIDMAKRNFFSHVNPDGQGPSDRLDKEGIAWRKSGENIAAGQTSAIFAHENWMNSIGHRENILGDFKRLGVGVYFGGSYSTYYTQKFYTPFL